MTTVIEDFVAKLGWDIDNSRLIKFNRDVHKLDKGLTSATKKLMGGFRRGFKLASIGAAALGGGLALVAREYAKIEDAEAAFTPVLKSVGRAKDMVEALNQTAATTPFQFGNLADAAKQLLPNMGGDIQKTIDTIRMLGDTAGGNAAKMQTIVRGYNKALLKGKVDMESLNMIAEAGVPIFNELGEVIGKKGPAMFKAISSGKVKTEQLTEVLRRMTSEGGIFFRGMEIASGTLTGKLSTLKDNVGLAAAELGGVMAPYLKALTNELIKVAMKVKDWIHQNRALIRTKITEFIKKIPEYLEKIRYWVPKIAKLVGVFLAITATVKALSVAMDAFVIVKALAMSTGKVFGLIKAFNAMTPAIGGAMTATQALGGAVGVVGAAFVGWKVGTLIHDEIVEPIMAARHEMELLKGEIDDTAKRDVNKRSEDQLKKDIQKVDKYQKEYQEDWFTYLFTDKLARTQEIQRMDKEKARLIGALPGAHQRANIAKYKDNYPAQVSDYAAQEFGIGKTQMTTVSIAKVESRVSVEGTSATPEEIERSSKKGVEKAMEQVKRNLTSGD